MENLVGELTKLADQLRDATLSFNEAALRTQAAKVAQAAADRLLELECLT